VQRHSLLQPIFAPAPATAMALDTFFRLEAQRNDYNSRVRLLREELGLLQQPGSYVGEVVKVMGTKKVLVKVHPEGKYGVYHL
jgi:ATP-dependent 26S proteasome regulatory subunit